MKIEAPNFKAPVMSKRKFNTVFCGRTFCLPGHLFSAVFALPSDEAIPDNAIYLNGFGRYEENGSRKSDSPNIMVVPTFELTEASKKAGLHCEYLLAERNSIGEIQILIGHRWPNGAGGYSIGATTLICGQLRPEHLAELYTAVNVEIPEDIKLLIEKRAA